MNHEPLLSGDWYRVASLRPRLRAGVRVVRQRVRGETWYVLSDPTSGRYHRFNRTAWRLLAACDGSRSLDEIWSERVEHDGEQAPTQAETIRIVSRGFEVNLFLGDVAPDAGAIVMARQRARRQRARQAINPLAFRVTLWDPDAWLDRHVHRVRAWWSPAGQRAVWLMVLAGAMLLAAQAGAFHAETAQRLGPGRMLLLMWLVYPVIKALHEAAHAFAVKVHGGEVHRVGITLLMLTPVPFVDASAAGLFAHKRQRLAVAAAGIQVEAVLATLALLAWVALEPGLARDVAFAVAFVGGVSTVLVNGNPLLRFDGYHLLTDAFELPNLGPRSARWWLWWLQRRMLGVSQARFGPIAAGELRWLVAYAPLSWLCRAVLLTMLAVAAARVHPLFGLALLALAVLLFVLRPALALVGWLAHAPELAGRRGAAWAAAAGAAVALGLAFIAVPLPHRTLVPAVVWMPDEAFVRPSVDGRVDEVYARDGMVVEPGTALLRLANETLDAELAVAQADLQRTRVEREQRFLVDAVATARLDDDMARQQAEVQRLQARVDALVVRAAVRGRVALDPRRDLVGRWLAEGDTVAHVLPPGPPLVRALVRHDDMALVRASSDAVTLQLPDGSDGHPVRVASIAPQAGTALPTAALGEAAGGPIPTDPDDPAGLKAREPRFVVELRLLESAPLPVGARALVTFRHDAASAAELSAGFVRRAFLRHFRT